jgi:hypothetical protein
MVIFGLRTQDLSKESNRLLCMKAHTGGTKEFTYTKEDLERIRKTETESSKAFKDAYAKWQVERLLDRKEKSFEKSRRSMIILLVLLFLMLAFLIFLRFSRQ